MDSNFFEKVVDGKQQNKIEHINIKVEEILWKIFAIFSSISLGSLARVTK